MLGATWPRMCAGGIDTRKARNDIRIVLSTWGAQKDLTCRADRPSLRLIASVRRRDRVGDSSRGRALHPVKGRLRLECLGDRLGHPLSADSRMLRSY